MIKPQKLRLGDKVATVSSSWGRPGAFPHRFEAGKAQLQDELDNEILFLETSEDAPTPEAVSRA